MEIIAARFGEEAATALRRLTGEAESALISRRAAPPLFVERRFAEPVAKTQYALQILVELSRQIVLQLQERKHGGRRFYSMFFRLEGLMRRLWSSTGFSIRDAHSVTRLFC